MINSQKELREYLKIDQAKNGKPSFIRWLSWNDNNRIQRLLTYLRYTEYYLNNHTGLKLIPYLWYQWNLRRMIVKTGIMLFPNTIGPGIQLMHPGFRRIDRFVRIGKNCTILPMVLFGKKRPDIADASIEVGDNCYISTGVTILGPVKIGNNVTIGAGAVVVKDIPDNTVVGGVPAKPLH